MLHEEHSAILSTFIKLPVTFKTFILCIFEWPLKTGFTVIGNEQQCFYQAIYSVMVMES